MIRNVAFLMTASKGGLSHDAVLRLTWRQFLTYLDAFAHQSREATDDGRKDNWKADRAAMAAVPELHERHAKHVADVKNKLAAWAARRAKKS